MIAKLRQPHTRKYIGSAIAHIYNANNPKKTPVLASLSSDRSDHSSFPGRLISGSTGYLREDTVLPAIALARHAQKNDKPGVFWLINYPFRCRLSACCRCAIALQQHSTAAALNMCTQYVFGVHSHIFRIKRARSPDDKTLAAPAAAHTFGADVQAIRFGDFHTHTRPTYAWTWSVRSNRNRWSS